jgi:hypothetical protein
MGKNSVVVSADSFGSELNALGLLVGLGSVVLGGFLAFKTHGAQMSNTDGTTGAAQGIGYLASAGIGIGGLILGFVLTWAGYVLRTLAIVASRSELSASRVVGSSQAMQQPLPTPIPAMSVPGFGQPPGDG